MFSFLLHGSMGSVLAPTHSESERLLCFLKRGQEEQAITQLISTNLEDDVMIDIEFISEDGRKAIHIACEKGFGGVLNELIKMHANLESRDPSSRTPLLIASSFGHMDCVHVLLESGADYLARDNKGMDVIALAATSLMREVIYSWVSKHQGPTKKAETPLKPAVITEEPSELIKSVLEEKRREEQEQAMHNSTPESADSKGKSRVMAVSTPIHASLTGNQLVSPNAQMTGGVMRAAIDTAAGFASPPNKFMNSLNMFKAVKLMNEKNSDVFVSRVKRDPSLLKLRSAGMQGRDGLTLLHYAAELGNIHAVKVILDVAPEAESTINEVVWNVDMQGRTPLHVASESGHIEVCKVLIEAMTSSLGRPVGQEAPVDLSGFTPSAYNAREENKKMAKMKPEEKERRSQLKELLFEEGDEAILPKRGVGERCGGFLPFGIASAAGWRVLMEDAHCAFSPIPGSFSKCGLFGVFDGHGGSYSSQFAASRLLPLVSESEPWRSHNKEALSTVLIDSLLALDRELELEPNMEWKGKDTEDRSGSTAVIALVTPERIVVANCGDCRAVWVDTTDSEWTVKPLSVDHKPQLEGEKMRIEAAGNTVVQVGDSWRVDGNLAVSRALGDFGFKQKKGVSQSEQAVTALAEIMSLELEDREGVLVMACDGIWDVITNEDICDHLHKNLKGGSFQPEALADVSDGVIKLCLERGSTDNMTVLMVRIGQQSTERKIDFNE